MAEHTNILNAHSMLEWLAGCDSPDEMHATNRAWLRANPWPPTIEDHFARLDDALAGWYRAYYDPRVVAPAIAELEELSARIVRESGRSDRFDTHAWVATWVHEPHPVLGGECPVHRLDTDKGVALVRELLELQQSGANS